MSECGLPANVGSMEWLGPLPERAAGCTVYKVDGLAAEVRCVQGGPWPAVDSEGDTCYDNTHFKTHLEALVKLRAECDAWLSLNFRARGRLQEQLAALEHEDSRAREGLRRALAGLGLTPNGPS